MKSKGGAPRGQTPERDPETLQGEELIEYLSSEVTILKAACEERLALIVLNSKEQEARQKVIDELVETNARLLGICAERAQALEELAAEVETLRRTAEERLAVIDALNVAFERLPS